jgi:hypothetical protein
MRMFLGMFFFDLFHFKKRMGANDVCYRPWLKTITSKLADKPVLNLVAGLVDDYQYLWDNYYFSTATL